MTLAGLNARSTLQQTKSKVNKMNFKRTLTPKETKLLGDNPEQRLHAIIDVAFKRMSNLHDAQSVESRIVSLMSDVGMNAREIMDAHNAVYGLSPISLSYSRFVINGMYQAGMLKRLGRGAYVKGEV